MENWYSNEAPPERIKRSTIKNSWNASGKLLAGLWLVGAWLVSPFSYFSNWNQFVDIPPVRRRGENILRHSPRRWPNRWPHGAIFRTDKAETTFRHATFRIIFRPSQKSKRIYFLTIFFCPLQSHQRVVRWNKFPCHSIKWRRPADLWRKHFFKSPAKHQSPSMTFFFEK